MNIIWLTPEVPFPPIGGKNGVYNRIVQLSRYNKIFLLSIAYNAKEAMNIGNMEQFCAQVRYYDRSIKMGNTFLKSLLLPFSVASRTLNAIRSDIEELLQNEKIDVIIIEFPNMAENLKHIQLGNTVLTLNQHNTEFKRMREMKSVRTIPIYKRLFYFIESYRLELYEHRLYKSGIIKNYTFFSTEDMALFQKRWGNYGYDIEIFPLGANRQPLLKEILDNHDMLFVSRLDGVVGVEAALWFVNTVMPKILEEIPDARIIIAGLNPKKEILRLECEHVIIIPNYEKLENIYGLANMVVIPLLSGGGVKGKLLEAIAFHKLVVTTCHGIEGTLFRKDEHVLLANESTEFAQACIQVLRNPESYLNMEKRAYKLFLHMYEWKSIGEQYNAYLTKLRNNMRKTNA